MLNNDEYLMLESGVGVDENNKKLPNYCLGRYSGVKGLGVSRYSMTSFVVCFI